MHVSIKCWLIKLHTARRRERNIGIALQSIKIVYIRIVLVGQILKYMNISLYSLVPWICKYQKTACFDSTRIVWSIIRTSWWEKMSAWKNLHNAADRQKREHQNQISNFSQKWVVQKFAGNEEILVCISK